MITLVIILMSKNILGSKGKIWRYDYDDKNKQSLEEYLIFYLGSWVRVFGELVFRELVDWFGYG